MASSSSSSIKLPTLLPDSKNPYVCKICGKSFPRSYGLERHSQTHNENRAELEIKCPFEGCTFSALQKSNVKNHYASVHEKRKHICTQPRISFGSPYEPDGGHGGQCGQLFSDQSALIRHEKHAHNYFRRQAKEAAAMSGSQLSSSASGSARQRRTGGGGDSVDLKFMPPLTYDPSAAPSALPSEKKVQSWLKSVDGRTAKRRPDGMDVDEPPQLSHAYATGHGQGLGHLSPNYLSPHLSNSIHPSPSISDSDSTVSGSASLRTASSAYNSLSMGPGMYYPDCNKTASINQMDCYDFLYNREDLRQHARMQGGFVSAMDML